MMAQERMQTSATASPKVQECLRTLPELPGVYQMLDEAGAVIYVGKSKCLKRRVQTYLVANPRWEKAAQMAPFIRDLRYTVMDTHLEAMLLECQLIKEIRPYFNVIMKNHQKYAYLQLESSPQRAPLKTSYIKGADTFGPFRSRGRLEELIDRLRSLYPITQSRNGRFQFDYHVLPPRLSPADFAQNRRSLAKILSSSDHLTSLMKILERRMQEAARQQKYEAACSYRDILASLDYVRRGFAQYQDLMDSEILYRVDLPGGCKVFYIDRGIVVDSQKVEGTEAPAGAKALPADNTLPEALLAQILEQGRARRQDVTYSDKEQVDYRAIVYGELLDAPEGAVLYKAKSPKGKV